MCLPLINYCWASAGPVNSGTGRAPCWGSSRQPPLRALSTSPPLLHGPGTVLGQRPAAASCTR
jgi:hypothetical protein